jgi:hypothetical protein
VTAYADSGVIAKLYVPEPNSPEAARLVSSYAPPLALTHLQALEVRNALRLKVFRGEKAEELSGKHAASTGCRSLDILHVAGTIILGVRDFLTFDVRQGKLARKARPESSPAGASCAAGELMIRRIPSVSSSSSAMAP